MGRSTLRKYRLHIDALRRICVPCSRKRWRKDVPRNFADGVECFVRIPDPWHNNLGCGLAAWEFIQAICWVLLFPALCVFEWNYVKWLGSLRKDFAFRKALRSGEIEDIKKARSEMNEELDKLLKYAE